MFKNPLLIVLTSVDLTGYPSDVWCNFARYVLVASARMMALLKWRIDDGGLFWWRFTIHIPFV